MNIPFIADVFYPTSHASMITLIIEINYILHTHFNVLLRPLQKCRLDQQMMMGFLKKLILIIFQWVFITRGRWATLLTWAKIDIIRSALWSHIQNIEIKNEKKDPVLKDFYFFSRCPYVDPVLYLDNFTSVGISDIEHCH